MAYKLTGRPSSTSAVRPGVYKCGSCRKQYSGTVGTVFEDSHVPLNKWLYAAHLMVSSKKGISANQLLRDAWGRRLQDGLVHGASHPVGNATDRAGRETLWCGGS